jgi:hypothetical protein
MVREIFEVYAKIIDANGTYNTLSGYPKTFDTRSYDNDVGKTLQRAMAEYHTALGAMGKVDTRQKQFAMILRASDGRQVMLDGYGQIPEDPDPEPEPEENDGGGEA